MLYMASSVLRTEKLCKSFSNGGTQQHVIKNLDLDIYEGDFTVIMGSSGSGKSTLLYALSGMDKPTLGKIYFGEMTFYTWGGFIEFTPPEWDRKMGDWIQLPAEQNP